MLPGLILKGTEIKNLDDKLIEEHCETLKSYLEKNKFSVHQEQITAWHDSFNFLKHSLADLVVVDDVSFLFEYMLPLERGRRPDVIILLEDKVIVLEFKMTIEINNKAVKQALGYREDLCYFHSYTAKNDMKVEAFLVCTQLNDIERKECRTIKVLTKYNFREEIFHSIGNRKPLIQLNEWYNSDYVVLPSMMEAVNDLFVKGKLPYIKNIAQGDLKNSIDKIKTIIDDAKKNREKVAIVLDGVPGSGKTLVGLQVVYDYNKDKFQAMYLSGNGPLISVLHEQLSTGSFKNGKAYLKLMRAFSKEYFDRKEVVKQPILVFDESQRAWDKKKMNKQYNEIEAIMQACDRSYSENEYAVLFCLYGSGQFIYKGEEETVALWDAAIEKNYKDWDFYFSENLAKELRTIDYVKKEKSLYLDTSIRNNFINISVWIESVISKNSNLLRQKDELSKILNKNFKIRITREFSKIIETMPKLNEYQASSRYGVIVSSRVNDKALFKYTNRHVKTCYIKEEDAGRWFLYDCKNMTSAASEFTIQGLEIEWPIVMFGGDYYLHNNEWEIDRDIVTKYSKDYKNFPQIMENVYRVLLSRGRRGMILFIPEDQKLDETYKRFKNMGIADL